MMSAKSFGLTWLSLGLALSLVGEMAPATAAAAEAATESGIYIGIAYGQSKYTLEENLNVFDIQTSQGQDDSDTATSLAMGFRVNRYFGVEVAYVDLGTSSIYATGTFVSLASQPITGRLDGGISSKGAQFSMLGSVPVKNLAFYGRFGLFMAQTELIGTVTSNIGVGSDSRSASTTAFIYGVGAGYTFLNHFYVNVDYTQYPKLGKEQETGQRDVSAVTFGFAYRF